MIQKIKSKVEPKIGRRIIFLHSSDNDTNAVLKNRSIGTITDLSPLPQGHKRMISIDWDNGSDMALVEGKDTYEVLAD